MYKSELLSSPKNKTNMFLCTKYVFMYNICFYVHPSQNLIFNFLFIYFKVTVHLFLCCHFNSPNFLIEIDNNLFLNFIYILKFFYYYVCIPLNFHKYSSYFNIH